MIKTVSYMKFKRIMLCAFILTISIILLSCGGGSSGTTVAGGGIGGTGKYTGAITGFGSVFVNGHEFQTTSASILVDDQKASQNELKVGMKVTVDAVDNIASSVIYNPDIKGPVSSKAGSSFIVLGQTVIVNSETKFCLEDEQEDCTFSFSGIDAGDFVEVSGFSDSAGQIVATLVADESSEEYHVAGIVSGLDTVNKKFSINSLTVNYSGLADAPSISNGSFVEVEGGLNVDGALVASSIENAGTAEDPGQSLELEGIITEFNSQSDFEVNGQRVQTSAQTIFENGSQADIAENIKVKVEGTVGSNGILNARLVHIEDTDIND